MKKASTKNSGRRWLIFFDAIFTNLAQQMNALYSAEQKGQPLGSQALM